MNILEIFTCLRLILLPNGLQIFCFIQGMLRVTLKLTLERKVTTFSYGPFQKNSPFPQEELNVHFGNNNKFLTVTRLQRVIELLYSQK